MEALTIYIIFSYIFVIAVLVSGYCGDKVLGVIATALLAPIMMPIILAVTLTD